MRTRRRYRLDRVAATRIDARPAVWTFAGDPIRGTEISYDVVDGNLTARNRWEFIVREPHDPNGRVEVRPRTAPRLKAWAELTDRSLTFMPATRRAARGRWYCQVALADATGRRSKDVVHAAERDSLPHWFAPLRHRMRRKESVRQTRGTDGDALVVVVNAGDHVAMIRLFFAAKVWILAERVVMSD